MGSELQWWHIVVPLFTGGAFGAFITAIVTSYRNRVQPVGYRIDLRPVFKNSDAQFSLSSKITIYEDATPHHFDNLFVFDIQISNKGNQDINEFPLGLTLGNGDQAVYAEYASPDRHHTASPTGVKPSNPLNELDSVLKPFNRGDVYSFYVYVVIPEGKEKPDMIELSSPSSIRFTRMPTMGEMIAEAASSTSLVVGPVRLIISGR